MDKSEALSPWMTLKKELEKIATSLGLTMESWGVVFDDDPALTSGQAIFTVRPEAVMSDEEKEQLRYDKEFLDMQEADHERDLLETRAPQAREDVESWLDGKE